MKAKELRIGNLVNCQGVLSSVLTLDAEGGMFNTIGTNEPDYNLPNIDPIPLTEEWLIKFRFVNGSNCSQGGAMHRGGVWLGILGLPPNFEYCFNAESSSNKSVTLQYVHQLQNLYFALTGEELTIK